MLVLLGISSVIAVILPNPRREARQQESRESTAEDRSRQADPASGKSGTPGAGAAAGPSGQASPGQVAAGTSGHPPAVTLHPDRKVQRIRGVAAGRLILTVEADEPSQVTIPALGRTDFADRWAPAVFDLILPASGGKIPVYAAPPGGRDPVRRAVIAVALPSG